MNVESMIQQVSRITGRPDQQPYMISFINQGLKYFHRAARWSEDFYEAIYEPRDGDLISGNDKFRLPGLETYGTDVAIDTSGFSLTVIDYVLTDAGQLLTEIQASAALRSGCALWDTYYLTGGAFIAVNVQVPFRKLHIGAYLCPPTYDLGNVYEDYWALAQCPELIMKYAIAAVYRNAGDDDSYRIHWAEFLRDLEGFKLSKTSMSNV